MDTVKAASLIAYTDKNIDTSGTSPTTRLTRFKSSVISLRGIHREYWKGLRRETIARCRSFTLLSPVGQVIKIHEYHQGVVQPPL